MRSTKSRTTVPPSLSSNPANLSFKTFAGSVLLVGLIVLTTWRLLERPALAEAEAAFSKQDHPTALRRAQDDLARHPSSRRSALIAARCLSQMLYAEEAERHYAIASRGVLLPIEAQRDRATGLYTANRFDQAASACKQILDANPDDAPTLILLSLLEFTRNRFADGAAAAERLAHLPEGKADGFSLLAMNRHAAKQPEQAVAASEALLAIDPEVKGYKPGATIFWFEYTQDLLALGRAAEARDHLEKVTGEHFEPFLLDILGSALKQLDDLEGAQAKWEESIRRDPTHLNPWSQLGRLYNGQKRFADAVKVLERAVAIEPQHLDSHYQLATAYKFLGRTEDAARESAVAEELRRKLPGSNTGMGASP